MSDVTARLEYLRGEIRAEDLSMGELAELQSLAEYIEPGDVELLEAAGVPEFAETAEYTVSLTLHFDAENPQDAANQFAEWLTSQAERYVMVSNDETREESELQF